MDSFLRIRRATRGEAELLLEIQKASSVAGFGHVFPPDKYPFPSEAVLDRWQKAIDDPAEVVVVGELANAAVGFAATRSEWLDALYVSPTCWSMGVGARLHDQVLTWIRDLGCKRCHLWVLEQNTRARRFYERRGWRLNDDYASCPVSSVPHRRRLHDRAVAAGRTAREWGPDDSLQGGGHHLVQQGNGGCPHAGRFPGSRSSMAGMDRVGRRRQTSRLPTNARQSRESVPVSYPRTQEAPKQATQYAHLQGFCREPSDGLEPSTPSLPCDGRGNQSQPTATVFAYPSRSWGRPICHWLPLVAPARLHKRSILGIMEQPRRP
jgi:GNAT superfamily N-acetyltransferase